jgi:hypothetical protein
MQTMQERILAMSEELRELKAQTALLATIGRQLTRLIQANAPDSPNYRRPLAAYPRFDWSSIEAAVIEQDNRGATLVEWNLHQFVRRAGSGKFGQAIWFSRPTGQDDNGAQYARLITFKDATAEPMPRDLAEALPEVRPLDVQRTEPPPRDYRAAEAQRRQNGEIKQDDPRQKFYALGKEALADGRLDSAQFNILAGYGAKDGWPAVLERLEEMIN